MPVRFGEKFTQSLKFSDFFQESMILVREVALYLDEDGCIESRSLSRAASLTYATESMQLTARLMRVTSWLLLHRAMFNGDRTVEDARTTKPRIEIQNISSTPRYDDAYDELPEKLRTLIEKSMTLDNRISLLDQMLYPQLSDCMNHDNPVQAQVDYLRYMLEQSSAPSGHRSGPHSRQRLMEEHNCRLTKDGEKILS